MSEVEATKAKPKKKADTIELLKEDLAKNRVAPSVEEIPTDTEVAQEAASAPVSVAADESSGASSGQPLKVLVSLLDDSKYQYRKIYDSESIDELAKSIDSVGQTTPIRIRKKENGRFEIISGHRRKRAAISRGWEFLEAVVVECDDIQAAGQVIAANESEDIGDYERACSYKALIDLGLNQSRAADISGVSRSLVSARMKVFDFPASVIAALEIHPRAISYKHFVPLLEILKDSPDMDTKVCEGIKMIAAGEWKSGSLIGLLRKSMNAGQDVGEEKDPGYAVTDGENRPFLTMRKMANGKIEIQLEKGVDSEAFIRHVSKVLRDEAAKDSSLMGGAPHDEVTRMDVAA
jgi:ParB/RepB/Spo0J family partition protein